MKLLMYREKLLSRSEWFIAEQFKAIPLGDGKKTLACSKLVSNSENKEIEIISLKNEGISKLEKIFSVKNRQIYDGIVANDPDIIHIHFGPDAVWILPSIPRGKRICVTFHGYDVGFLDKTGIDYRIYLTRLKKLFKRSFRLIAVSQAVANKLIQLGAPAEKVVINYIGIDINKAFKRKDGYGQKIISIGRLVKRKGHHILVDAFLNLLTDFPDATLTIIGSGPEKDNLVRQAYPAGGRIVFLDAMSNEEMMMQLSLHDIFCLPSRDEAFGIVFLEAQLAGLPVIGYGDAGVVEAMIDGKTGLLIERLNPACLKLAICSLLSNESLLNTMSKNGQDFVKSHFSIEDNAKSLLEIYKESEI